jgi:hypothetical protein
MPLPPYYQDDAVTIYNGDCAAVIGFGVLGHFDLLLTDPPYGIGADAAARAAAEQRIAANGKTKAGRGWKLYDGAGNWDTARPAAGVIRNLVRCATDSIIWGGNYFADCLPISQGWIVWDKGQREFSLADGELAWTSFDCALRIIDVPRGRALQDGKQHPTQKSLEVISRCIAYADRNATRAPYSILDPFMGSGTTLRAAKDLRRKAIGIEIEEKYCEIAAKRMQQEVLPLQDSNYGPKPDSVKKQQELLEREFGMGAA